MITTTSGGRGTGSTPMTGKVGVGPGPLPQQSISTGSGFTTSTLVVLPTNHRCSWFLEAAA